MTKPLLNETKHKLLSVAIVSIGAFLGFEALSFILGIYQIQAYMMTAIYIFLFHIFWLTFLFDLHFKKRYVLTSLRPGHQGWNLLKRAFIERTEHVFNWHYLRHYLNFFILPGLIYWSVVVLLFLNPFDDLFKQLTIILGSFAMTVAYWYFKDFYSRRLEVHEHGLKILALIKLFAAYLVYSAALGATWYYGFNSDFLIFITFFSTFWLLYQAVFQHKLLSLRTLLIAIFVSVAVSAAALMVYDFWNVEYLTGGLVMLAVYNFCWGLLHHKMDGNLDKKIIAEYFLMTLLVLSILIAGHDFGPRIS